VAVAGLPPERVVELSLVTAAVMVVGVASLAAALVAIVAPAAMALAHSRAQRVVVLAEAEAL
jgi:hypothetical protein